jgi:hypothetical protein
MTEPTDDVPSLMDDETFLEELERLDGKPPSVRPRRVADQQVARLDDDMPALSGHSQAGDVPSALVGRFDDDDSALVRVDREPRRGLGPVLLLGLAAGAAAAAFVLHERVVWIISRAW